LSLNNSCLPQPAGWQGQAGANAQRLVNEAATLDIFDVEGLLIKMPKLKTKKGVAKRFGLTKKGKIKYSPGGKSHLLSGKNPRRLRKLRRATILKDRKEKSFIKIMLPYR
jgi:large subunit ribosomal protein L35